MIQQNWQSLKTHPDALFDSDSGSQQGLRKSLKTSLREMLKFRKITFSGNGRSRQSCAGESETQELPSPPETLEISILVPAQMLIIARSYVKHKKPKVMMEQKMTRIPKNELIDSLFGVFKKYVYLAFKGLATGAKISAEIVSVDPQGAGVPLVSCDIMAIIVY
ncbi:hypothetical protein C2G38_2147707 [Gigaspora rosea]|uniref:Uncharacterized protein n=1 Tax=Gigaspora rosea TaxID=44941 RepID=A0A397UA62_9GLOM|nr:hypothetical protein C2G38_2147707 [Gigaspora rosea]